MLNISNITQNNFSDIMNYGDHLIAENTYCPDMPLNNIIGINIIFISVLLFSIIFSEKIKNEWISNYLVVILLVFNSFFFLIQIF